jgi:NAD(P)H-hydrate epimerase
MPTPILSVVQMRDWEKATWAAGRTETEVISRAGHIVANRARQMTRPGDLIVVLAGKGHNGDDARHASQNLSEREMVLINVIDPDAGREEFRSQLGLQPALVIDGLFGIGLNRPLDAAWVRLIEEVNRSRTPVLSIDLPSGLDAESGRTHGAAVRASVTLTLAAPKLGLLTSEAWAYVGRLEVAPDIGLIPCPISSEAQWTLREDFAGFPPLRPVDGHKGTFGHLGILAGSPGYHGAAVLAARGALRAQPGLVTVFTLPEVYLPIASQLQAAMVHSWQSGTAFPDHFTALLAGPGLAAPTVPDDLKYHVRNFWREFPGPMVVDASALEWLEPASAPFSAIRVITPHPGEAARMLGRTSAEIQGDRSAAVAELSRRYGNCRVLLKGHQSLVGRAGELLHFNSSGNPCLAQGGSGDLLAGYLAGLLAQPLLQSDPLAALRYAAWQHGASADRLSAARSNWTVEDLAESLGSAKA